ncbi:MAG TPA: malonyl-ACP O-methyltransferase BioC [Methylophilaceae bacterium]|nr:malonyl-ACP O-methyltransferase BioC [Methylophilaceae bacterium]
MDEYTIDKAHVRASFNRAAETYDAAAVLQKLVRDEMFDRLGLIKVSPKTILDAGCGTGHGSFQLQTQFRSAQIFSLDLAFGMLQKTYEQQSWLSKMLGHKRLVCADIENLPVADNSMDIVWSNLALQWCNDLDQSFTEISRVLKPNSLFIFSTFGPDTLKELRTASNNGKTHVSRFIDMHDIGDALTRNGFSAPVLDVERYTLTYHDVKSVMTDLKSIGANNATQGRGRGLTGKSFFKQLAAQYEQFRVDGKLPATFEVIYGHAWTAEAKQDNGLGEGVSPISFRPRS